jgi:ABC-type molybdate transport system permease subunit
MSAAAATVKPVRMQSERATTALSLGLVTTYLTLIVGCRSPRSSSSRRTGVAGFLGRGHEPGGHRRAQAHALDVDRRRPDQRRSRHDHGMGARRDSFRGKSLVNAIIDLPFALPTIVAGLTLLALYGPQSPVGINVAFTTTSIVLAMLFVTLPFVVRTVQPVLLELDQEMEQAAKSLGASNWQTFRRVVFPNVLPGILSGVALAFAKAVGEFGSLVIITGNLPYKTQVSSVFIFSRIESGDRAGAAAVAVVLLAISFGLLLSIGAIRHFATRHDRD